MTSGYSGVRLMDALAPRDRSKTFLNGNRQILVASPGYQLALVEAQADEERMSAPTHVLAMPSGGVFETMDFDFEKEKFTTIKISITRKWQEKLVANTRLAWGEGKQLPIYLHHNWRDVAHGWFGVDALEVDDEGLWINVDWHADTARQIAERRYRYVSVGWLLDGQDPKGKTIGQVLYETSLTNSPYFPSQPGLAAAAGDMLIAAAVPVDAAAQDEEAEMLEKLRTLLGLSAEATEEEVGAAAEVAVKAGVELAEIDKALESVEGADRAAKLATLTAAKPAEKEPEVKPDPKAGTIDPEKGTAGMGADAAEMLVEAAVAAGKVPPKGEAREKLAKALATLSVADAKEVLALVGAGVPKGGDLKSKADGGANGAAPGLREAMRKNLGLSREALEKFAPDKVASN